MKVENSHCKDWGQTVQVPLRHLCSFSTVELEGGIGRWFCFVEIFVLGVLIGFGFDFGIQKRECAGS